MESALTELRDHVESYEADCEQHKRDKKNSPAQYAARNTLLITQARILWLEEILLSMKKGVEK